jgi:histidyl-tRNA synthetase
LQASSSPSSTSLVHLLPPCSGEPQALLAQLSAAGHPLAEHPDSKAALDELALLFEYLGAMNALGNISFDLSLARGLDYYTGAQEGCSRSRPVNVLVALKGWCIGGCCDL